MVCPLISPRPARGFTLIETLVVLSISVGLVITMALLFRAVGHTTLLLRGSNDEWALQAQLREQLHHLMTLPEQSAISGNNNGVILTTWKSRHHGFNGKPVIAQYRYEANDLAVYYRETDIPAWWQKTPTLDEMRQRLMETPETRLSRQIDDFRLEYLPNEAKDLEPGNRIALWQKTEIPHLLTLNFSRASRHYALHLETRGLPAQAAKP